MAGWQKGQSGNPNGRPLKSRALTAILESALNQTTDTPAGKVKRKKVIAEHITRAATEGRVALPDGTEMELSPRDWLELLKWLYAHIDGPPRAEIDITSGGEKLNGPTIYLPSIAEDDQ